MGRVVPMRPLLLLWQKNPFFASRALQTKEQVMMFWAWGKIACHQLWPNVVLPAGCKPLRERACNLICYSLTCILHTWNWLWNSHWKNSQWPAFKVVQWTKIYQLRTQQFIVRPSRKLGALNCMSLQIWPDLNIQDLPKGSAGAIFAVVAVFNSPGRQKRKSSQSKGQALIPLHSSAQMIDGFA